MFCLEYSMCVNKSEFMCENMNKLQSQLFSSQYLSSLLKSKPSNRQQQLQITEEVETSRPDQSLGRL